MKLYLLHDIFSKHVKYMLIKELQIIVVFQSSFIMCFAGAVIIESLLELLSVYES